MVFEQNRSPHQILGMSTPEEEFSGKKPDVSYFRIFGSSVYYHVTKYSRNNLEPTIEIGIFVGSTDTPHKYRVYLPKNTMNVVRQDINLMRRKPCNCPLTGSLIEM